jgi:hypothetical protein
MDDHHGRDRRCAAPLPSTTKQRIAAWPTYRGPWTTSPSRPALEYTGGMDSAPRNALWPQMAASLVDAPKSRHFLCRTTRATSSQKARMQWRRAPCESPVDGNQGNAQRRTNTYEKARERERERTTAKGESRLSIHAQQSQQRG